MKNLKIHYCNIFFTIIKQMESKYEELGLMNDRSNNGKIKLFKRCIPHFVNIIILAISIICFVVSLIKLKEYESNYSKPFFQIYIGCNMLLYILVFSENKSKGANILTSGMFFSYKFGELIYTILYFSTHSANNYSDKTCFTSFHLLFTIIWQILTIFIIYKICILSALKSQTLNPSTTLDIINSVTSFVGIIVILANEYSYMFNLILETPNYPNCKISVWFHPTYHTIFFFIVGLCLILTLLKFLKKSDKSIYLIVYIQVLICYIFYDLILMYNNNLTDIVTLLGYALQFYSLLILAINQWIDYYEKNENIMI